MLRFMKGFPKAVNSSGAVSPAPRATARRVPVTMPLIPAGRMTFRIVPVYDTPRASAASRSVTGMSRRVSSVDRVITGSMIMAMASPPESAEKWPMGRTIQTYATIPITIDGMPMRVSMDRRATEPSRVLPLSERKMPAVTPRGTETIVPSAMMMNVPTIPFAMPPPVSPDGWGSSVRNAQLMEEAPRTTMKASMSTSGTVARSERASTTPRKARS